MVKLFANKTWACSRMFIHAAVLLVILLTVFILMKSTLFLLSVCIVLIIVYAFIFRVQMIKPLIEITDEYVCVTNLFYKGKEIEMIDNLKNAIFKNRFVLFEFYNDKKISIKLNGIDEHDVRVFFESVQIILKENKIYITNQQSVL